MTTTTQRPIAAVLAATVLACSACTTVRSSAGGFVKDIRVTGHHFEVERCNVDYVVKDATGAMVILTIILLPLLLFGGNGNLGGGGGKSGTLSTSGCVTQEEWLPGNQRPPARHPPDPREVILASPPVELPPPAPGAEHAAVLAGRARFAATNRDCRSVRRFAIQVEALDPAYYATTFTTDAALAACLPATNPGAQP